MRTTRRYALTSAVVAVLVLMGGGMALSAETGEGASYPEVSYPVGYRSWTHVKSNLIGPKSPMYKEIGGYQRVYADEKGMEGTARAIPRRARS